MTPDDHRERLLQAAHDGTDLRFVPFWGHRPDPDGSVGRGCLSQWWPAPFDVDGTTYPTAEHWMMAGKARLFGDDDALARALTARSPGAAKAVGRTVRGFDEQVWAGARFDLVVAGNLAKFTQHDAEREVLLRTGDAVLVEASPFDRVWGVGLSAHHPDVTRVQGWRGLNLLGFALMEVRDRLR